MHSVKPEIRMGYTIILCVFAVFLVLPLGFLLIQSFATNKGFDLTHYLSVLSNKALIESFGNSIKVSSLAAAITTILAFVLAYTIHGTRVYRPIKTVIKTGILIPMLLPTITYGFAIMYSFGNQGIITKLFGRNLFEIYGFNGLLIGYCLYTLPPAFCLFITRFSMWIRSLSLFQS